MILFDVVDLVCVKDFGDLVVKIGLYVVVCYVEYKLVMVVDLVCCF